MGKGNRISGDMVDQEHVFAGEPGLHMVSAIARHNFVFFKPYRI